MLVDELLTPADCKLPQSSPIARELLEYVLSNYADKPRETQAIVFAVAHLRYSRRKKLHIHEFADPTTGQIDASGARTFAAMAREDFDNDCRDAFTLFNKLYQDVLFDNFNKFEQSIKRAISPHKHPRWRVFIDFLFFESFKHLVVLFMAIFFWALGILYVIDKAIPPLRAELSHFMEEEKKWFLPPSTDTHNQP